MKYKYEIVRSARKTVSIDISAENKITVKCPWGLHIEEIEKILAAKSGWIEKVVLNNSQRLARNDAVIELREIYVNGKRVPLIFSDKCAIEDSGVYVKNISDIAKLYIKEFSERLNSRVFEIAKTARLFPNTVAVKDYTARWGCCDAKNNLIFNYKMFMLPLDLQDYIIVHELCHTLCHNHSGAFWHLVGQFVPDYKKKRNQLKDYNFITTLY